MKRGRGRPPVLVGEQLDAVCKLLAEGALITDAARAVGVAQATVHNTRNRGGDAGARIDTAIAAARAERREARHGHESCYTHHGCRRPACVEAATAARQERRQRDRTALPAGVEAGAVAGPQHLPPAVTTAALYDLATPHPLADAS